MERCSRILLVQDGSGTSITLTSTTGFPTGGGTIAVGTELITYTGKFK